MNTRKFGIRIISIIFFIYSLIVFLSFILPILFSGLRLSLLFSGLRLGFILKLLYGAVISLAYYLTFFYGLGTLMSSLFIMSGVIGILIAFSLWNDKKYSRIFAIIMLVISLLVDIITPIIPKIEFFKYHTFTFYLIRIFLLIIMIVYLLFYELIVSKMNTSDAPTFSRDAPTSVGE